MFNAGVKTCEWMLRIAPLNPRQDYYSSPTPTSLCRGKGYTRSLFNYKAFVLLSWKMSYALILCFRRSTWSQPWPWRALCRWVSEWAPCISACCGPRAPAFSTAPAYCHPACRKYSHQGCLKCQKKPNKTKTDHGCVSNYFTYPNPLPLVIFFFNTVWLWHSNRGHF